MYIFILEFKKVVRTFISFRERISLNEEVNTSSPFYKNETKKLNSNSLSVEFCLKIIKQRREGATNFNTTKFKARESISPQSSIELLLTVSQYAII